MDKEKIEKRSQVAVRELSQFQIYPKKPLLTKKQEEFLKRLIKQHGINYEKKIESLTKSQASREIDLILSTYGRKL